MAIKKIDGVVLIVTDLNRSLAFYREKLGMAVKHDGEGIVDFDTGGSLLSILDLQSAVQVFGEDAVLARSRKAGRRLELAVEVNDVDKTFQQLTAAGVKFLKTPADQAWGQRTADFADPDGNIWEIYTWKK